MDTLTTVYSWLWFGWLLLFVGLELSGMYLARKKQVPDEGTFSYQVWAITKQNRLFFAIFTLFWIVLGFHFFIYK